MTKFNLLTLSKYKLNKRAKINLDAALFGVVSVFSLLKQIFILIPQINI